MPDRSWKLLSTREIADYHVLRLREDRYLFEPTRKEMDFIVCDSRDWVLVIPITSDGQVVMIRQYRHGVRQVVLEIPGGLLEPGETPEQSAVRELREETGYEAGRIRAVGSLMPNPAINSAHMHILVAEDCRRAGEQQPDPFELIEVNLRPLADIPRMIASGELCHALTIAAFALAGAVQPLG